MTSVFRGTEPQSPEFPRLVIKTWVSSDWSTALNDSFKWQMNPATVSRIQIWWRSIINGKTFVRLRVCLIVPLAVTDIPPLHVQLLWKRFFGRLWKMLFASRVFLSCNRIKSAVLNKDAPCVQQTWSLKHIWWWSISGWSRVSWCRVSIPYLGIRTQNHGAFISSSWFSGRFVLLNTPLLSHWWWTCSA